MTRVHWLREAPAEIRSHGTLARIDYADLFYGPPASLEMSPEAWARALQHAPARLRLVLRVALFAQRRILGLRLEQPSAERPFGWVVGERGDHWFRLEAASWMGEARLVFHRDDRHVSVATLLRYDRRIGRLIWAPVSVGHRRVGIALLRYMLQVRTLPRPNRVSTA